MMRAARTAIAGSRGAAGHDARSGGGLIKPVIVYALLSLIAATRRPSAGSRRAAPHPDSRRPARRADPHPDSGRPATGAFGTTRGTDEPRSVQHDRAGESERGRRAKVPWQIPWTGWKDIFWRAYDQLGEDTL